GRGRDPHGWARRRGGRRHRGRARDPVRSPAAPARGPGPGGDRRGRPAVSTSVRLRVNGEAREGACSPWRRLLDVLRVDLGLTGTKEGCGEGECGACTVLIDGEVANACLVAAGQADGRAIETIEALGGDTLSDVQEALIRFGGTQCGICTPGI